jgi:hypothetical protein
MTVFITNKTLLVSSVALARLIAAEAASRYSYYLSMHVPKYRKFDVNPFKRLADILECWEGRRALSRWPRSKCDPSDWAHTISVPWQPLSASVGFLGADCRSDCYSKKR